MPHGFVHALGDAGAHQDLAHEDVKRDGQEDRVVAGRPADFAKGADQRHRGILIADRMKLSIPMVAATETAAPIRTNSQNSVVAIIGA